MVSENLAFKVFFWAIFYVCMLILFGFSFPVINLLIRELWYHVKFKLNSTIDFCNLQYM